MKVQLCRVVAFVAQRLISGLPNDYIYDYQQGRYIKFSGSLSRPELIVYDSDRGCYVHSKASNGKIWLFDFGESTRLTLEVAGDSFRGLDYGSSRQFAGSVRGRLIRIFDYDNAAHYTYGF